VLRCWTSTTANISTSGKHPFKHHYGKPKSKAIHLWQVWVHASTTDANLPWLPTLLLQASGNWGLITYTYHVSGNPSSPNIIQLLGWQWHAGIPSVYHSIHEMSSGCWNLNLAGRYSEKAAFALHFWHLGHMQAVVHAKNHRKAWWRQKIPAGRIGLDSLKGPITN